MNVAEEIRRLRDRVWDLEERVSDLENDSDIVVEGFCVDAEEDFFEEDPEYQK